MFFVSLYCQIRCLSDSGFCPAVQARSLQAEKDLFQGRNNGAARANYLCIVGGSVDGGGGLPLESQGRAKSQRWLEGCRGLCVCGLNILYPRVPILLLGLQRINPLCKVSGGCGDVKHVFN